jgi:hypothetical protein
MPLTCPPFEFFIGHELQCAVRNEKNGRTYPAIETLYPLLSVGASDTVNESSIKLSLWIH